MSVERTRTLCLRTPEGIAFSFVLASPFIRFLALMVDLACLIGILWVADVVLVMFRVISADTTQALSILAFFLLSLGYWIGMEWVARGQTLGKRLLRLRVMDAQGLRLHFSQIVIRNLLRAVDSLPGFYLVGAVAGFFSPLGQRLGDLAANTIVVRAPLIAAPDLDQIADPKYNSLRSHPHLVARLRQQVAPAEAGVALQAVMRRDELDPAARVALFQELAACFRELVKLPEEVTVPLTDEQYVRNVVDVLFVKRESVDR